MPVGDGGPHQPLRSVRAAHVAAGSRRRASSRRCSTTGRACRRRRAARGRASRQSSFDAWIKLYKPDESNLNTTVSYYLKGGLAMVALDLQIRRRTEGARSLDDVLRALWRATARGASRTPTTCSRSSRRRPGCRSPTCSSARSAAPTDPDLAGELAHLGLELRASADPAQTADGASALWLGATLSGSEGHRRVRRRSRRTRPACPRATSSSRSTGSAPPPRRTCAA